MSVDLHECRRRLPLPELMARLGLGEHAKARARCPWPQHHKNEDRNPSFGIFQNNGAGWGWKCFVCGGGDEVDFIAKHFALSNGDAIRRYGELAGVDGNTGATRKASSSCTGATPTRRVVTLPAADGKFAAGFAQRLGVKVETITKLIAENALGYDAAKKAIVFACQNADGSITALHLRGKSADGSRWFAWRPEGCGAHLWRLPALEQSDKAIVCEGESDAIAALDAGLEANSCAVVAKTGANVFPADVAEQFRGKTVFIVGDLDEGGRKGAADTAEKLRDVADVRVVTLPEMPAQDDGKPRKDLRDWLGLGNGKAELLKLLDGATRANGPAAEWPDPKPLPDDLPAVEAFNFDCLPATLRPWIEDISERMQCPPDYPAAGALVALGSLIGRKVGIRPKQHDDWLLVANLWGMVIGRPGLLKTPALDQVLLPLNRLSAEAFAKYKTEAEAHEVAAMLDEQRKKLAEKEIAKLLKGKLEAAAHEAAKNSRGKIAKPPVLRRYIINDATVEKLGELLSQNPNGLLLHRDELVGFLRSLDKEGHEDWRAFYLESWNGTGSFTCDRIGRGTVRIESNTVSIIGAIQPGPLADYLRQAVRSGVGDDGLLQRFQVAVWPDTSKEWRHVDRWPNNKARAEAAAVFEHLDTLSAAAVEADCSGTIPFLNFTSDAQEQFNLWRAGLECRLRNDEHPAFEAHLSKYRKLVPTVALVLHLANRDKGAVTLGALKKALLWEGYLESHARRIYSAVLRPDAASARELAKHIKRGDLADRFTLRETYRKGWTGLGSKEDAEAATEILCDLGWIRALRTDGSTHGRPASPTFAVNPKVRNPSDAH
jgi:putative DNA primase/helicase